MATLLSTDPIDGAVDDDGYLILSNERGWDFARGADGVRQHVRIRLAVFQGEWFLNLETGIAYWDILGNKYSAEALRVQIAAAILGTAGIASLDSLAVVFDASSRTVTVNWSATCVFGDTIQDSLSLSPNAGGTTSG